MIRELAQTSQIPVIVTHVSREDVLFGIFFFFKNKISKKQSMPTGSEAARRAYPAIL
jgi:hypothetical protein